MVKDANARGGCFLAGPCLSSVCPSAPGVSVGMPRCSLRSAGRSRCGWSSSAVGRQAGWPAYSGRRDEHGVADRQNRPAGRRRYEPPERLHWEGPRSPGCRIREVWRRARRARSISLTTDRAFGPEVSRRGGCDRDGRRCPLRGRMSTGPTAPDHLPRPADVRGPCLRDGDARGWSHSAAAADRKPGRPPRVSDRRTGAAVHTRGSGSAARREDVPGRLRDRLAAPEAALVGGTSCAVRVA